MRSYGKPSFQPVEQEEVQTPTVGEYKEEEITDIVEPETSVEDGAETDKAEEQKSATEHSDAVAEDTDDAGNALAEEEDSAVAKDTATEEDGKKDTDSVTGVEVSATANEPVEQTEASVAQNVDEKPEDGNTVLVYINGQPVKLTGKPQYIFVDIFDFYEFDR